MIIINVSQTVIDHCKQQVNTFDFGKRYTANGTKEQQLTGLIGQSVVMQLFGLGMIDGRTGFDDGIDIEYHSKKIDVKTMGRTTDVKPSYTNNFLKLQDYLKTDTYIFCSFNKTKNQLTICGWISKKDFVKKRKFYPKGSIRVRDNSSTFETFADLYEIDNTELNQVNTVEALKNQLQGIYETKEVKRISNYKPTNKEFKMMSICIKAGYKVYPKMPVWVRYNPKVYLVYSQYGREMPPKSTETFSQTYLTYETIKWYRHLYRLKVVPMLNKPLKSVRNVMLPPPPEKAPPPPPPN